MSANIRIAGVNDTGKLYEINKICLPIYYSYLDYVLMLISSSYLILIAEDDNNTIGYLVGEYNNNNNFHILSFGVHPSFRNKGIGRKLIDFLVNKIKNQKYTEITLNVHVDNIGGIAFYEKLNFKAVKLLKNYYQGALSDAKSYDGYRMKKNIN